jgi:hypothetical protein
VDLDARPHEVTLLKIKHIRLREKYGVSYREVYAILSDLLFQNNPGMQLKSIRKDPTLVLKIT